MNSSISSKERNDTKKIILKQGNCLELVGFSEYNVVHSRDVFLHIKNKIHLFEVVKNLLISDGRLGFSDYCLGLKIPSQDFRKHLNGRKYYLLSFVDYIYLLRKAGFINVLYEDKTLLFLKVLKKEIQNLEKTHLNYCERNEIRQSWLKKIQRSEQEEQCWGWFFATKD